MAATPCSASLRRGPARLVWWKAKEGLTRVRETLATLRASQARAADTWRVSIRVANDVRGAGLAFASSTSATYSRCPAQAPFRAPATNTLTHSFITRVHAGSLHAAFSTLRDSYDCLPNPAIDSKRVALAKHALARSYERDARIRVGPPAFALDERVIVSTRFGVVVRARGKCPPSYALSHALTFVVDRSRLAVEIRRRARLLNAPARHCVAHQRAPRASVLLAVKRELTAAIKPTP
jgi:hypothetical protein